MFARARVLAGERSPALAAQRWEALSAAPGELAEKTGFADIFFIILALVRTVTKITCEMRLELKLLQVSLVEVGKLNHRMFSGCFLVTISYTENPTPST